MRPSFHYYKFHLKKSKQTVVDWMKQNFFLRLLKNKTLKSIFSIDELLVNSIDTNSENIKYLEDPVNDPIFMDCNGLKEKYGLRSLSKVILIYGVIDHRKNINALLSILDVIHGWSVLIVGKQDRFTEVNLLSSQWNNLRNQGRIAVINRYISTKEEEEIFNLSDVVWVGYLQHYQMSGVLVKAGVYKRPIIACEEGLIGWHAKEYELGVRTNFSKESLKKAFDVLSDENIRQVMGEFGYSKFKNYNWSNFKKRIKS
jgi:glycosyltransferase involved in cell wall biosynthesis